MESLQLTRVRPAGEDLGLHRVVEPVAAPVVELEEVAVQTLPQRPGQVSHSGQSRGTCEVTGAGDPTTHGQHPREVAG